MENVGKYPAGSKEKWRDGAGLALVVRPCKHKKTGVFTPGSSH
jgi:hypothetical protein